MKPLSGPQYVSGPFAGKIVLGEDDKNESILLTPEENTRIASDFARQLAEHCSGPIFCPHGDILAGKYGSDDNPEDREKGLRICENAAYSAALGGGTMHVLLLGWEMIDGIKKHYLSSGMRREIRAFYRGYGLRTTVYYMGAILFWKRTQGGEFVLTTPCLDINFTRRTAMAESVRIERQIRARGLSSDFSSNYYSCSGDRQISFADLEAMSDNDLLILAENKRNNDAPK